MNLYEYFQSHEQYFWMWEDNGEVLEIPGGSTIAYTELIKEMLACTQEQGLPPFGSLLLFLIATNTTADNPLGYIENIISAHLIEGQQFSHDNGLILSEAMSFLKRLTELSSRYKTGKRRLQLLQVLFRDCHNSVAAQKAKSIVSPFLENFIDRDRLAVKKAFHSGIFSRDFKTIALLNRRFPSLSSISEQMAQLPELELLPPEEESSETGPKDFIDELAQHPDTFRVGSLIRPIWAGFKIPLDTAIPSQQPLGGVSDLTNKGDFDKLLISEFAYDDLTFLSRLANNEALYLHREIPPAADDRQRILLADISLLSWGTPKTLAYACCLALTRHPKASKKSQAYAVGDQYYPLSFDHIDEVIDGLQYTARTLHPAPGIDLLLKEHIRRGNPEIFLVIAAEAWKQPAVQRVLSEYTAWFRYIITADQQGHMVFYRYRNGSRTLIQQISLDLEQLWRPPARKAAAPVQPETETNTEGLLPILFATPHNIKATLYCGTQLYCVADRRLFMRVHKTNSSRGYALVLDKLPPAESFAIGKTQHGETLFLYFTPQNRQTNICNLDTGATISALFKEWKKTTMDFFFYKDGPHDREGFFHLNHTGNYVITLRDDKIDIEIVKENTIELRKMKSLREQEQKNEKQTQSKKSILKNIQTVGINSVGNLLFNQHEFTIYQGKVSLGGSGFREVQTAAVLKSRNLFEFPDKSTVAIDPSGMLILRSSDPFIPPIYVPSVLNASLGIATREYFAGNDYYAPAEELDSKAAYSVLLVDPGPRKLEVVRVLQEELGIGLQEAGRCIGSIDPVTVKEGLDHRKAIKLLNRMIAHGARGKIEQTDGHVSAVISTSIFEERYIQPFIKHITEHGATGKTT